MIEKLSFTSTMRWLFGENGVFNETGSEKSSYQDMVDEALSATSEHDKPGFWYGVLQTIRQAPDVGEDTDVAVSYLMALEKNTNATFEVSEIEDDYRAGVIAHVAGEDNLAIAVYLGYEYPVVNGFLQWSQFLDTWGSDEIEFNLYEVFSGLPDDYYHGLVYGVHGTVEQSLTMALMLLTGKVSPVHL